MSHPILMDLLLPVTRLGLPGSGWLVHRANALLKPSWPKGAMRRTRGRWHGYVMELDLADWAERRTFFLGRYYEVGVQLLLRAYLRPGDTFLDVGGNIGMISLLAARLVGPQGRVHAFEPNPRCVERFRRAMASNGITQVTLHAVGLSDAPGSFELNLLSEHSGAGTMAALKEGQVAAERFRVDVVRGDDAVGDGGPVAAIKIDVEGFECRAVAGLERTIRRDRPMMIMEVVPETLEAAGSTAAELFGLMQGLGYRAYGLGHKIAGLSHRLRLRPIAGAAELREYDVAWLHPEDGRAAGLSRYMGS